MYIQPDMFEPRYQRETDQALRRLPGPDENIADAEYRETFAKLRQRAKQKIIEGMTPIAFDFNSPTACEDLTPELIKHPERVETLILAFNQDATALKSRYQQPAPAPRNTTLTPGFGANGDHLLTLREDGWAFFGSSKLRCRRKNGPFKFLSWIFKQAWKKGNLLPFSFTHVDMKNAGINNKDHERFMRRIQNPLGITENDELFRWNGDAYWVDPALLDDGPLTAWLRT